MAILDGTVHVNALCHLRLPSCTPYIGMSENDQLTNITCQLQPMQLPMAADMNALLFSVLCKGSHQYRNGNNTVIKTIGTSREEVIDVASASFPRLRN